MKKAFLCALPLLLPISAVAQTSMSANAPMMSSDTAKPSALDMKFVKMAAISGMSEVSDGQLASTAGGTDTVKQIGTQMVTDHTKANDQLMSLAQGAGIAVPTSVGPMHAAIHAKLQTLSGSAFDKEYLTTEYKGHVQTIALFKMEAAEGRDPQLKTFATSTLPILQQHLTMIKSAM